MFTNRRFEMWRFFCFFPQEGKSILKTKRINENLEQAIDFVVQNKKQYLHRPDSDFTRVRKLSLYDTIHQILAMEGGSLKKELYHFTQLKQIALSPSAFVQQRSKIRSSAFEAIFKEFNSRCNDTLKFKGYRLLAVDGSVINQYRDPNLESFVTYPGYEYGFNQTHLNAIYDLLNKTYVDILLQPKPKQNEPQALIDMISRNAFCGKNIIIADRGYEGYNLIAHIINKDNVDLLMRVKHDGMREIKKLPMVELDKDISFEITTTQTKEDALHKRIHIQTHKENKHYSSNTVKRNWDFPSPYRMNFRVVRFMLDTGEYETIVTSLPKSRFSLSDIKKLYHMRWGIETSFRELKYAIGLINLHCKKEELVEQEIYAAVIMYNYCSRIAANASIKQDSNRIHDYQVDFTMAIHLCKWYYKQYKTDVKRLILDISQYIEPIRPGRHDKRNVKAKRFVGFTYRIAA